MLSRALGPSDTSVSKPRSAQLPPLCLGLCCDPLEWSKSNKEKPCRHPQTAPGLWEQPGWVAEQEDELGSARLPCLSLLRGRDTGQLQLEPLITALRGKEGLEGLGSVLPGTAATRENHRNRTEV